MTLAKDHKALVLLLTLATVSAGLVAIATDFKKSPVIFFFIGIVLLFILINPIEQRLLRFN